MARGYGQIGPLKQIRNELDARGIDRFDSLREFDAFLENYESERAAIYNILDDLAYRCPYCGATSLLKIIDNKVNNFKDVLINELYNEHM